ncbi:MAG: hypothetical protein O7B99_04515 [Planctomycetota bacterium]|nr:hypothetical protein [Planctomycetota bacterium]
MIHLLGIAAAALTGFPAQAQEPPTSAGETWREGVAVERIEPPEHDFYSKRVLYRDIPIEAHADVADEALFVAGDRLDRMLRHAPRLVENLVAEGAELHVIGRDQQTSDLPEHRHWKGRPYDGDMTIDERTRGVGGIHASCGEENLLGLEGDRYWDRDICTHEFAHTVHRYGLSDDVQAKVLARFRASRAAGLWEDAYAGTNDDEYFAEPTYHIVSSAGTTGRSSRARSRGRSG